MTSPPARIGARRGRPSVSDARKDPSHCRGQISTDQPFDEADPVGGGCIEERNGPHLRTRIIDRAVASGQVRNDLTLADFPLLTSGIMATMYYKPGGNSDWRRHLELALDGIRIPGNGRRTSA